MESFRGSSQQAQAVREQFGNKVEEVLASFDVPAPPVSHVIIQPGAAVEGWDEQNPATAHFYTDGSYTPPTEHAAAKCGAGVHMWLNLGSYDASSQVTEADSS